MARLGPGEGQGRVGGRLAAATLARLGKESQAEESIVIYCVAAARCARGPALARECVCARVCAGECVSGGRARAGVGARGERPPKTP